VHGCETLSHTSSTKHTRYTFINKGLKKVFIPQNEGTGEKRTIYNGTSVIS
jgi:hypothetical protein